MSITNYSELKTAVGNWLNRSDLTARIPEFITLAETRLMRGDMTPGFETPPVRVLNMEATSTLSCSTETTALPSDFLELKAINLTQGGDFFPLALWTGEEQVNTLGRAGTGTPTTFSIDADGSSTYLRLHPVPDATYTVPIRYYAKYDAFSAAGDTNWLLTNAPGAYLFATLTEAYIYTRNNQEAQLCALRTKGVVEGLDKQARAARLGSVSLTPKPGYGYP